MSFVLKKSGSYNWPVCVKLPIDGGKYEKQTFDAEFKRLPQARINQIRDDVQAAMRAAERNEPLEDPINDQVIAREVLMGWAGILDEDGDEVAFSQAACDELLNVPMVAQAVIEAYFQSLSGAKAKN